MCKSRGTRMIGSLNLGWGRESAIGSSACGNGAANVPCTPIGYMKHWGTRFSSGLGAALPITINAEVAGPLGGFGWHLRFDEGAPLELVVQRVQVPHDTKLLLSIAYPSNVVDATVTAFAPSWCFPWESATQSCTQCFTRVSSVAQVRASLGDTFHLSDGVLTVRIVQPPESWTGRPSWTVPVDPMTPFMRDGVRIQRFGWHSRLVISADCVASQSDQTLCAGTAVTEEPTTCAAGYDQTAYDQCCASDGSGCIDPEGLASAVL